MRAGKTFLGVVTAVGTVTVLSLTLAAAPSPSQEEEEYVGSDFCAECHVDQWEKFQGTVHDDTLAYMADMPDGVGGCEACHGPGLTHVELAGGEEPGFREAIDGGPEPDSCFQCHAEQRGEFSLTERHPVIEGLMECSDCHDPHGSLRSELAVAESNESCTTCHTDKAGPWVFPHPPGEVESCTTCHQPHGSVNPHLLPYREITFTCLSCHTAQPAFHTLPGFAECNACHVQIHGSNLDPFFLE